MAAGISLLIALLELVFVMRAILRPHRTPASRIAWVVVIAVVPVLGVLVYVLFGETNIGRDRVFRALQIREKLSQTSLPSTPTNPIEEGIPDQYANLFRMAGSVNGFPIVSGNRGTLLSDTNETINSIIADIDSATEFVHLLFYIWLVDENGTKVMDALKRASARGVICRVMVDGLGSRDLINTRHWDELRLAGVHTAVALAIGNPFLRMLFGRVDLRNHRKIVVIDHRITYCGSQNCADAEFRVKPKYAPWVDAMIRFEGPIAWQNQFLFACDWMTAVNEDLSALLMKRPPAGSGSTIAQAIGTGPTFRYAAMPEMFVSLMHAAQQELVITTPYYVPDESMQNALCAAAVRGVRTRVVFPARNDSRIVAAASESYYPELLKSGVEVYEYVGGLLHTKSLTIDGSIALIGSANLDRRSFDLNYENNVLFFDETLASELRQLQERYIAHSDPVTLEMIQEWSVAQRLWRNSVAMVGPIL
ncbi:MAG: cardiolipin synthase [Planctomycetaceae bacterium]|nr:cardiolipin synthase [Planctomycetaceae bacterium]